MKKTSFLTSILLVFPIIIFLGIFFWWKNGLAPVDLTRKEKINFVIKKGESLSEISSDLKTQNLINNSFHFKLLVFFNKTGKKIQAGNYYLSLSMSSPEIADILTHGSNDQRVTIVEGLRSEQVANLLVDQKFPVDINNWEEEIITKKLEGKLFPDTYFFPKQATEGAILKIIDRNFKKKVLEGINGEIQKSNLTLDQALILASIVERETKEEEDRRLVAGILLKRWQAGWSLQADATVQYAIASVKCKAQSPVPSGTGQSKKCEWWPKRITQKDLEIKSPYNTYKNRSLPPKPICSPGLSAIKAVLNPQNSTYWFYLSDSEGKIRYANNNEEHALNIRKYLLENR